MSAESALSSEWGLSVAERRTVVVVGPLPPPIHGAALVTQSMLERIGEQASCLVVDTGISLGSRSVLYHVRRIGAHLRALGTILVLRARRRAVSVYIGGAAGGGVWYQAAIAAVGRLCRTPIVLHHHSYLPLLTPKAAMRALVSVGSPVVTHVALSPGMEARLRELYPRVAKSGSLSNVALLPPVRQPNDVRADLGSRLHLGHLSNLSFDKGLDIVLTAFAHVSKTSKTPILHLAGPFVSEDAERAVQEVVRELGEERVKYHGALDRHRVPKFLSALDVLLFPSRNEAEPLVVIEALGCGLPVICLPVGCLRERLQGEGWIATDPDDFTLRLKSLVEEFDVVSSPALLRASWRDAAKRCRANFGPVDMAVVSRGLGL